jgi:hypothetical protein
MDALAHLIYACQWALYVIILWYVIGLLAMPERMILVCRALLIVIATAAVIASMWGAPVSPVRPMPSLGPPASIMK